MVSLPQLPLGSSGTGQEGPLQVQQRGLGCLPSLLELEEHWGRPYSVCCVHGRQEGLQKLLGQQCGQLALPPSGVQMSAPQAGSHAPLCHCYDALSQECVTRLPPAPFAHFGFALLSVAHIRAIFFGFPLAQKEHKRSPWLIFSWDLGPLSLRHPHPAWAECASYFVQ